MTQAETAKLVAVLMASFPSNKATAATSQVYERMLADLDYAAAQAAVERLLATARFMPTIGEIRETALALTYGEQKPGGEAWSAVVRAMKAEGAWRTPGGEFTFPDPVTAECVALMDWRELCLSTNTIADRARFIELYDSLAVQHRQRQLSDGLPAMQRFKAIEAQRAIAARTGETDAAGAYAKVLSLVPGKEPSS